MTGSWEPATRAPLPAVAEIHVWRIDLESPPLTSLGDTLLSADEISRVQQLRFEQHRRLFMAGRSAMRSILGSYTDTAPDTVRFSYGEHGKPHLYTDDVAPPLTFNFSNADGQALLAVAADREVGIDIENLHRDINTAGLVRHILTDAERTSFNKLPEADRKQALLIIWTRKEAWIKALGEGLFRSVKSFAVPYELVSTSLTQRLTDTTGEPADWTFLSLNAHPDYLATLTARGTDWSYRCFDWQPDGAMQTG